MFSLLWDLLKGGALAVQKENTCICPFIDINDDKHTTFQLLATKGDNEVVIARLAAST